MNEIEYNGEKIQYTIIKLRIKNLYIHIKDGNVIVKAPIKLKEKYIKEFVNKKSKWIYEKLKQSKEKKVEENIQTKDIEKLKFIVEKNIQKYSKIIGICPNKVRIKDIKYAWGSCSSNRNITINLNLAKKEERLIEYVVLHEMCHLRYMNHSKEFWKLVEKNMEDYKKCRKMLNSNKIYNN